ncbi:hypothetical protein EWI61_13360 [Methylolobus aquaticus]|nr:hypothetical protein EWI61_13360 [Methylolobus aquaticus]
MNAWLHGSTALSPLLLMASALVPSHWANRHARTMAVGSETLMWIAFAAASLAAMVQALPGIPENGTAMTATSAFAPVAYFDALTAVMLLLVSFIGTAVTRYARNYMDGDPEQGHFCKWLSVTIGAVLGVIVSGNLLWFTLAWMLTSLSLHRLLTFYADRPGALLAARKKFVISRLGDAALIIAMVLIYREFGTLEFAPIFAAAERLGSASNAGAPALSATGLTAIGALLIAAAALKSAQFPFHSWLPEIMETPTPVSALMHAGIINAGGFLVVRMSPVIVLSPEVLSGLAVVGAATALYGSLVMVTQTSIKKALAFSTVAQMGFMMLQCGLGAFSAAILHIVAHSLYKAHAFLSTGSVVDLARASWVQVAPKNQTAGPLLAAFAGALALSLASAYGFGVSPASEPGVVALGAVLTLAVTFLLWKSAGAHPGYGTVARATAVAACVCIGYFALQTAFAHLLRSALPPLPPRASDFDLTLTAAVTMLFVTMLLVQSRLPGRIDNPLWQRLYVHFYNGLYISTIANRVIERIWPLPSASEPSSNWE